MKNSWGFVSKKLKHYSSILFYLFAFIVLSSHDLYLKMESYFLKPNQEARLSLYNGTFESSENIITRDRMIDASIVAHGARVPILSEQWEDQDSTITQLPFKAGKAGTYVAGVSTKARNIELTAEKFNLYLEHDGVLDMLSFRKEEGLLEQDALESYEKHVKAIYQVGDIKTNDWKTVFDYPIEFVPKTNPYEKYTGEKLDVQLLLEGEPLPNQLVYADYVTGSGAHSHDHSNHTHDHSNAEEAHTHTSGQQLRTNEQGIVSINLPEDGIYYLRTIYMVEATESNELTHRSKWATLSFEVTHGHDHSTHSHEHHDHEKGTPGWILMVGSLLLIVLLFFLFKKKS